jgi:hypothetical protein
MIGFTGFRVLVSISFLVELNLSVGIGNGGKVFEYFFDKFFCFIPFGLFHTFYCFREIGWIGMNCILHLVRGKFAAY